MAQFRVALYPSSLARSRAFYADVLGFDVIDSWDRPDSQGVLLDSGPGVVELLSPPPTDGPTRGSGIAISIETDDAQQKWDAMGAYVGARIPSPTVQPWGHRSFSVSDPDGVSVTFFEVIDS